MSPSAQSLPSNTGDGALADLLDQLANRIQAGEPVDVEAFLADHPEHADRLRRLLPGVQLLAALERSGPASVPPAIETEEQAPGALGDFRIVREVGRGGMGVVYEAEQASLQRRVALKVLPLAVALDRRCLQRFLNEARAAAGLHHTNIVPVHFVGSAQGIHFYAMQYIEGQTLAAVIRGLRREAGLVAPDELPSTGAAPPALSARPVPEHPDQAAPAETVARAGLSTAHSFRDREYFRTVARLGVQVAEALQYAHDMGIVHRDIKPGNLLLDWRGTVWITDFGLAQLRRGEGNLTRTGDLVGTLRYMSPEQALAQRVAVDHRADVYSLGATLYELLTLRPVLTGSDREELLRQIAQQEAVRPRRLNKAVPAELETVVLKALEKNPADRYGTAQALADDLRRWLEDRPVQARRPSPLQRLRKWARRRPAQAALLAVSVLAMAVLLGVVVWHDTQMQAAAKREHDQAEQARRERDAAREQRGLARQVVDNLYVKVASKWLSWQPEMDQTQREFLDEVVHYYREFARIEEDGPEARYEAAMAHLRVGELSFWTAGPLEPQTKESLCRAAELLAGLASDFPDDQRYAYGLARAYTLGGTRARRPGAHEEELRLGVALLKRLIRRWPEEAEYRRALAQSLNQLGAMASSRGQHTEAKAIHQAALDQLHEFRKRAAGGGPYLMISAAQANVGNQQAALGDLAAAIAAKRSAIATFRLAATDGTELPKYTPTVTPFWWHNLGCYHWDLSRLLRRIGNLPRAREALAHALAIHSKLTADYPKAEPYQTALMRDYVEQTEQLLAVGARREAARALERAAGLADRLLADFPSCEHAHTELLEMLVAHPDLYPGAWRRALEVASAGVRKFPGSAGFLTYRALAQLRVGDDRGVLASLGEVAKRAPEGQDQWAFLGAIASWRLGEKEEARRWYVRAERWLKRNASCDERLTNWRAEAARVLGIHHAP